MRIVIDGDNFAGLVIPTPHPKDKPTFILYLFATQLSRETPKRTATQSPSFFSALLCTVLQRTTFTSKKSTSNLARKFNCSWHRTQIFFCQRWNFERKFVIWHSVWSFSGGVFCGGGNWMSSAGEQSVDTRSMCSSSNWLESQVSLLWNRVYLHRLLLLPSHATGKLSHGQNDCQKWN